MSYKFMRVEARCLIHEAVDNLKRIPDSIDKQIAEDLEKLENKINKRLES